MAAPPSTASATTSLDAAVAALRDKAAFESCDVLLNSVPAAVIAVRATDTAKFALRTLLENGISSVPVYSHTLEGVAVDGGVLVCEDRAYVGFVDCADCVALMLEKGLRSHELGGLFGSLQRLFRLDTSEVALRVVNLSHTDPFQTIERGARLLEAGTLLASGYHRIALVRPGAAYAGDRIAAIISQLDAVRWVAGHMGEAEALSVTQLGELGFCSRPLVVAKSTDDARGVLWALHSRRISAVPLVDATTGAFMDQFGVADIRAVANLHGDDLASALDMDVFTLLARLSLAEASHGVSHAERTLTMSASDTFGKAVEALAATGAHRVFILGEGRRPVGVVSASDVLRVALGVRATA